MPETEIVTVEKRSAALAKPEDVPADPILGLMERFASNPNLSPEAAKALMEIYVKGQRDMQEMQDERAFAEAMADFKKNPPRIVKNRTGKMQGIAKGSGREYAFDYSYADLAAYCEEAMPLMAQRGITWSYEHTEENGRIKMRCLLRYGLYERPGQPLSSPLDTSGAKNDLQSIGSTLSYLEKYTFCAATGLVAAMPDTDGKTPAETDAGMSPETLQEHIDALNNAPTFDGLKQAFGEAYSKAKALRDNQAKQRLTAVYEALKKEFAEGAR